MKKIHLAVSAILLAVLAVLGAAVPAQAIGWYNTVNVVPGSYTITVKNNDGAVFRVAAAHQADNIRLAQVPPNQCLRVDSSSGYWVKRYKAGSSTIWVSIPNVAIGQLINLRLGATCP